MGLSLQTVHAAEGSFDSGSGTETDPYVIRTDTQLADFAASVDSGENYQGKYIALGDDIDLSGTGNWNPIGADGKPDTTQTGTFAGDFNGNHHSISGMTIEGKYSNAGLFSVLSSGARVRNIVMKDVKIAVSASSDIYAGAVVGQVYKSGKGADSVTVIDGCSVNGKEISALSEKNSCYAGGIIGGTAEYPVIINCFSDVWVTAEVDNGNGIARAGGITGYARKNWIANCGSVGIAAATTTANGGQSGSAVSGGLVGYVASEVKLCNVYSTAEALLGPRYGQENAAGIIGGSEHGAEGSRIYYATDALIKNNGKVAEACAFGYSNPNIYPRSFTDRFPAGSIIGKTTADMQKEDFAMTLNVNLQTVKEKTGMTPDVWVIDGGRVILSAKQYEDNSGGETEPSTDPDGDDTPSDKEAQAAADAVTARIEALPDDPAKAGADLAAEIAEAYRALSDQAKALVPTDGLVKLQKALNYPAESSEAVMKAVKMKKGGKAVAKWAEDPAADGYLLYYKAKGQKAGWASIEGPSTVRKAVRKLKAGKKYTFRVRTFTKIEDLVAGRPVTVYGQWSNAKKAKAKK